MVANISLHFICRLVLLIIFTLQVRGIILILQNHSCTFMLRLAECTYTCVYVHQNRFLTAVLLSSLPLGSQKEAWHVLVWPAGYKSTVLLWWVSLILCRLFNSKVAARILRHLSLKQKLFCCFFSPGILSLKFPETSTVKAASLFFVSEEEMCRVAFTHCFLMIYVSLFLTWPRQTELLPRCKDMSSLGEVLQRDGKLLTETILQVIRL